MAKFPLMDAETNLSTLAGSLTLVLLAAMQAGWLFDARLRKEAGRA